MTRHGRNATAGAVYTYHEKKKDTGLLCRYQAYVGSCPLAWNSTDIVLKAKWLPFET